jgi:hypothetical protein
MPTITDYYNHRKNTPSDINEHIETLKNYASECEHITEMGVRTVVSTWAFLEANPKKLISIDINPCPIEEAAKLAGDAGIDFKFIQASTLEIEIEETDLLFIDTWHVYQQLKQEFKLHCDKARKYIILHDTTTFGERGESGSEMKINIMTNQMEVIPFRGLWPAVEEFLQEHPEWKVKERFTHNNGLTVLERI